MLVVFDIGEFGNDICKLAEIVVKSVIPFFFAGLFAGVYVFNMLWIPFVFGFNGKMGGEYGVLFGGFLGYLVLHGIYIVLIWEQQLRDKGGSFTNYEWVKTHERKLIEQSPVFKFLFIVSVLLTPLIINYIGLSTVLYDTNLKQFSTFVFVLLKAIGWIATLQGGFLLLCRYTRIQPSFSASPSCATAALKEEVGKEC